MYKKKLLSAVTALLVIACSSSISAVNPNPVLNNVSVTGRSLNILQENEGNNFSAVVVIEDLEYKNGTVVSSIEADDNVTLTFGPGSSTEENYVPKVFTSGTLIRLYYGNELTVSLAKGYEFESIIFYNGDSASQSQTQFAENVSVSSGTFNADELTWTPGENIVSSVTLTNGDFSSAHLFTTLRKITVNYRKVEQSETPEEPTQPEMPKLQFGGEDIANGATLKFEGDDETPLELHVNLPEGALLYVSYPVSVGGQDPALFSETDEDDEPVEKDGKYYINVTENIEDGILMLPAVKGDYSFFTRLNNLDSDPLTFSLDVPTGISALEEEKGEQVIYDLLGNRLSTTDCHKGIYIINGKKTILR